jgi:hypothetical protein
MVGRAVDGDRAADSEKRGCCVSAGAAPAVVEPEKVVTVVVAALSAGATAAVAEIEAVVGVTALEGRESVRAGRPWWVLHRKIEGHAWMSIRVRNTREGEDTHDAERSAEPVLSVCHCNRTRASREKRIPKK